MAHRKILTSRQRKLFLKIPENESTMLTHYVLSDSDLAYIHKKQGAHNQLGFAIQLCALRYPGRYLSSNDTLPYEFLSFVGVQIGLTKKEISDFTYKQVTRYEHLRELQKIFGYLPFHGCKQQFVPWLEQQALETRNNAELVEIFVKECRSRKIIIPGLTVIERLCADARVSAERNIVERISSFLSDEMKEKLERLLSETIDGRLTIHGWLKRFEAGHNSADVNRLLDKLEYLQTLDIPESLLDGIPSHRVIWLRQQGEAYYADGLRDINETRRLAILAVCVIE